MSADAPRATAIIGATGTAALGVARFLFLALGTAVFLLILLVAWWLYGKLPSIGRGQPAFSWAIEPPGTQGTPLVATHPTRGREEGWQFGGPGTNETFAALVLAEPDEAGRPFTLTTPQFWQFEPLRVLRPRVGGPHYTMTTRWGTFAGRDLIYEELDGRVRTCIVFRNAFETSAFALGGYYCAAGVQTANAASLACLIDRIKLAPAQRESAALAYLGSRAGQPALCQNTTFYPPGTRRVVRDRKGGVVRMAGGSSDTFPLWPR
ncbi:MAG TPA: hypothetical protein VGV17_18745 [Bosea sp. (in: a-proteobacteria)]|jgi:hypothetical protein|uniref:hypothetical protein n=1 Tax=Bosea sp. (in: a-proteobacteria) TaxID=1871050 RepID=UPI002DDCEB85|nr:hypothetical protein [Bosea sp. (in: a-proteobacteria)]HEV2555796.1 hypothetical protein [Bosea sp. (in: a-proteobacteria)]